jgi:hypothetical protein
MLILDSGWLEGVVCQHDGPGSTLAFAVLVKKTAALVWAAAQ